MDGILTWCDPRANLLSFAGLKIRCVLQAGCSRMRAWKTEKQASGLPSRSRVRDTLMTYAVGM